LAVITTGERGRWCLSLAETEIEQTRGKKAARRLLETRMLYSGPEHITAKKAEARQGRDSLSEAQYVTIASPDSGRARRTLAKPLI
jgi:hypothetical protein